MRSQPIMTPDPPPPSSGDGKHLPPRHRPTLGNLSQDTTELDLWAYEEDLETPQAAMPEAQRGVSGTIPQPRERRVARPSEADVKADFSSDAGGDRIKMNVGRGAQKPQGQPLIAPPNPESAFDDLENWDDAPTEDNHGDLYEELAPVVLTPQPPVEQVAEVLRVSEKKQARESEYENEFSPRDASEAKPLPLRPHLGLSKMESAGMISLIVLLVVGGLFAYMYSIHTLPAESSSAANRDFPIKGSMISVNAATSYWRTPIDDGPNPETFRRGTKLLPVLVLEIAEGRGDIRVLFRNEERETIGDAVTRTIHGSGTVEIPATAGFSDIGMHAAYRTGDSKPWTVEVLEAVSGKDVKSLFQINISTDRR
jgi:hypothetical protein